MQGVAYPFFVGWYTGLLWFKNQKENEKSIVKNENKDEADVSLQTILNASNSIVDKEINEIDNDNLIRQSLTGNTSIDYYN